MQRLTAAALLVVLGLGAGLWIGFNAQSRALAEQSFERATQYVATARVEVSSWLDGVSTDDSAKPTETAQSEPEAPTNPGKIVALRDLWDATRQIWFSLLNRLEITS